MTIINQVKKFSTTVKTFVKDATTSKYAKLSTPELKAKLSQARADARAANDRWQDSGMEDFDNGMYHDASSETRAAENAYRTLQNRVNKLEKLLHKRGADTAEAPPRDRYDTNSGAGARGFEGASHGTAPRPPPPSASREPASRLHTLKELLTESSADRRAFQVNRLPASYLSSHQLRNDVRALIPTVAAFKEAALKLHPDKLLPHANVAGGREAAELAGKANALWQVFTSVKRELT